MGLCYEVLLQEDFDWGYVGEGKEKAVQRILQEFITAGQHPPEVIAQWYGHILLDLDKTPPECNPVNAILLKNSDSAYYWHDSRPWEKLRLKKEENV